MNYDAVLEFFQRRRKNYLQTFATPWGRQVLADLMEFCCAQRTTAVSSDAFDMAIREGRRQAWLRIERAMQFTPEQMMAIMSEKDQPNG